MATALVRCDKEFLVAFGTSSGQLILERLDIKAKQLTQVDVKQHQAAMLSMKRIQLDGMSPMIACGFTDGSVLLYSIDKVNGSYTATLLDAQKDVHHGEHIVVEHDALYDGHHDFHYDACYFP